MNVLKQVFQHEVCPATGCTEPVAVALACGKCRQAIEKATGQPAEILDVLVTVDPGVMKNGAGVTIPNTNGQNGLAIAAALGVICSDPNLSLEALANIGHPCLAKAKSMIDTKAVRVRYNPDWHSLRIEAELKTSTHKGIVIIRDSHKNVVSTEIRKINGEFVYGDMVTQQNESPFDYKEALAKMTIAEIVSLAQKIDDDDHRHLQAGVNLNLALSQEGLENKGLGSNLRLLSKKGLLGNDIILETIILTTGATDARMAGSRKSAMSSGGSGNQGVVAILVPYSVGRHHGIPDHIIRQSIALSHLVNSYVKCFSGALAPTCGCAIAAGTGAAAAIVFQQNPDPLLITKAIKIVIADIAGILCDGAKGACSLKVANATRSAIQAAYLALQGYGVKSDGIVEETAEKTIFNLGKVSTDGMSRVDKVVLGILAEKAGSN